MNGLADAYIGSTAAKVAVHGGVDFEVGGLGVFGEERGGGHDLPGLTVAALGNIHFHPSFLQGMRGVCGKAFDGGDVSVRSGGQRGGTGALRLAVDVNGAGAALADTATVFGAVEIENVAQHPKERGIGGRVDGGKPSINCKFGGHSFGTQVTLTRI